jgi:hypothetical protein
MDNEKKGDIGDVGEVGEAGDRGTNSLEAGKESAAQAAADLRSLGIDATAMPKGIVVDVPAIVNPLVTHNTGS